MSLDAGIYKLVYEYYEARILYGYYSYGDQLPSIPKICAVFHMAPATVRAGLAALEKQGYIKIDARRSPKVMYKSDPAKRRRSAAGYFVPRKKGIQDLLESCELLFEACCELGLSQWSSGDWEKFRSVSEKTSDSMVSVPVQFYLLALRAMDNSLILNLYWEVLRFLRFPYLAEDEEWNFFREDFQGKSEDEIIIIMKDYFKDGFQKSVHRLFEFMDECQEESEAQQAEPVSFQWNIYRQRPQLCYTLVCSVIRDIAKGVYKAGTFLPSLPKMAKYYDVSVSTVRRSLSILNSLGITESFQGKGTQVHPDIGKIDFGRPEIRDGLRLYLESLQLLKLTIRRVLPATFCCVPESKKKWFTESFYDLMKEEKSYLCFELCFAFIEEECPFSGVKECYRKLRELTAWGYPFTLFRLKDKVLHAEYRRMMELAAGCLRAENFFQFADYFEVLFEQEEQNMRETFCL